jgi:EpsI family protein
MIPRLPRTLVLMAALMVAASVSAVALRPTEKIADARSKFSLEEMVPTEFGEWRLDHRSAMVLPSPDTQAALNKIYNQTLSRTYVNTRGQRVMLSIAYGGDQSDAMQVHMPEGCYAGQGFAIKDRSKDVLKTQFGDLPVSRLVAYQAQRHEPITYWMVVGKEIARTPWEMKMIKLRYSVRGLIPEGLLFRVSSITPDASEGYAVHQRFADAMIASLSMESRDRLFGKVE